MLFSPNDYAAVVFDLDGTLLDTLRDISESANRTLELHGYPAHPMQAYRHYVGDGPDVLFQRALRLESSHDSRITELVQTYRQQCINQDDQHTALYPGLADLLGHLQASQLYLTILTNKQQLHAERCVERFLSSWEWKMVLGSGDHVTKKPDPTGALRITQELNISPDQCLYLGDSDVDMKTAKRAGMTAIGVLWGFRDSAELKAAGADRLIQHPSELIAG